MRLPALLTPENADRVRAEDLSRVDELLGGRKILPDPRQLRGVGVWSYSESDDRRAVRARRPAAGRAAPAVVGRRRLRSS